MFVYNIDDLAVIYDTLEFLNQTYNIIVKDIRTAENVDEVKSIINKVIKDLIANTKNKSEIRNLKKYILK